MRELLAGFKGRRVFVTGDTGFKGAWLAYWLARLGAEVHGFALPPERDEDLFHVLDLGNSIEHVDGDIRDLLAVEAAIARCRPEYAFHLAAQSLVKPSYAEPTSTFSTNVLGTVHVLDALRRCSTIEGIVAITSDKCYRDRGWIYGYREHDELGGHDPYSASKAAAEHVVSSYRDSFFEALGVGVASARAGNVVGGGDWANARIVPDAIRALRVGEPLVLRRPEALRPWQHVLEPLGGYLLLALRLAEAPARFGGAWNFGPRQEATRSVREVAESVVAAWGGGRVPIHTEDAVFHETTLLRLSIDKATQELAWTPRWDFDETIRETVSWYRAHAAGQDMRSWTGDQIDRYMEAIS